MIIVKRDKKAFWLAAVLVILVIIGVGASFLLDNNSTPLPNPNQDRIYCQPQDRNAVACTAIYDPVCGWFNPDKVQCVREPCAETFGNNCGACINEDVLYYTKGPCLEQDD